MVIVGTVVLALLTLGMSGWSAFALHYTTPGPPLVRNGLAVIALLAPLAIGYSAASLVHAGVAAGIVFAFALALYLSRAPQQQSDWQRNVGRLAHAELDGDQLTVHNVRSFEYRSETDYTPHWETRRYELSKLVGLDMFFSHWAGPSIAHTIMSWSFEGGEQLAISIETRNRVGQAYSAIAGFFRQFPIYYVVADERDVVRLRTNYRGEHVWLYRLRTVDEAPRALLLDYVKSINRLAQKPAWYNALTDNCTTTIRTHVRHLSPESNPWRWQLLANGHLPELLYEQEHLDASLPFPELHDVSNIDERAKAAPYDDFSRAIRSGLPDPRPPAAPASTGETADGVRPAHARGSPQPVAH
jgi:uncharacterized protein DUF4105